MSVHVGQQATVKRTFTQSDFDRFAVLSGDDNPIHVDPGFSARTKFGRTVAHGMLLYSVVCSVLGIRLPGPGTLQIEQELMFPSATPAGEEVEIRVEITDMQPDPGLADLTTLVLRPDGQPGLQGRARVLLPTSPMLPTAVTADPPQRGLALQSTAVIPVVPVLSSPKGTSEARPKPESLPFKGLQLGHRAQTRRTLTPADLAEYADLTGDTNPLFTDQRFAWERGLEGVLVPGGLLGGLFSYLLGTELPGRGTNYLKQRLHFPAPAYVNRELEASVEIVRLRPAKQLVNLSTVCADAAGTVVCHGEALVLVSDV